MMIDATGILPTRRWGDLRLSQPTVLVDGAATTELTTRQLLIEGPCDARSAVFALQRQASVVEPAERIAHTRWLGQSVRVVATVDLGANEQATFDLFVGRISESLGHLTARDNQLTLGAVDRWTDQLEQMIVFNAPATVQQSIDQLAQALGSNALRVVVSPATLRQALRFPLAGERSLRSVLNLLDQHHRIGVRQDRGIELREYRHGRPIVLRQGVGLSAVAVETRRNSRTQVRPTRHLVRAVGERLESTFDLTPAWNAADEAGVDGDYQQSISSDWPRFANVYRLWLLNETGELGEPRFQLETLIGDGRAVPAHPIPFGRCLTRDAAGQRLQPIVEFSDDGGASWQRYPGRVELLADRAGLRLADDALATSYFTAARTTGVRLRVTASVQNPLPIERVRWAGNPFAASFHTQVINLGDRFVRQRVLPSSRFAAEVASGQRTADERDDRPAMDQMLVDAASVDHDAVDQVYRTNHVMIGLAVGDRILDGLTGSTVRLDQSASVIRRIEHRWDDRPGTTIHVGQ